MSSPHDIAVLSGIDPLARVLCPICREPFVMELGVSKWCKVKLADQRRYRDVEIVFDTFLCAWLATRERKKA
jgi:hypothetical protein